MVMQCGRRARNSCIENVVLPFSPPIPAASCSKNICSRRFLAKKKGTQWEHVSTATRK